jgi:6-phosphofructokinase 1
MKIAISTGGGDAPGLNAVIRAATFAAIGLGFEIWGIRRSYEGLLDDGKGVVKLDRDTVRGIAFLGGTILGTTNRGDPFAFPVRQPDGSVATLDRSEEVIRAFRRFRFDALVAIGGDGSLEIARRFSEKGLPVVGVPKTIDNDLAATDISFGFDTAVSVATDALTRLHTTAESHERVIVCEVMGRYAGWIALYSGLAAMAHAILIPEIPFEIDRVCEKIMDRELRGRRFAIVVVAEGAAPKGGSMSTLGPGEPGRKEPRLGGIAERVAEEIAKRTGKDTRAVVLGHIQRGGMPTALDRLVALRFGAAAVRACAEKRFGTMVALRPPNVVTVPLAEAVRHKSVPLDGDVMETARALGIAFGD